VIIELDGKKIVDPAEFPRMITFGHIGKAVTFKWAVSARQWRSRYCRIES